MAPEDRTPPHPQQDTQAAAGGPVGVGVVTYAEAAERLLDNGYAPLPIRPGTKAPIPSQWNSLAVDAAQVGCWSRKFPNAGVGLRTGSLVAVDLDILDPDLAHEAAGLVERRFGSTLVRIGRWPKRTHLFRTEHPFAKLQIPQVELLGLGQQMVAFGLHPDLGRPYYWLGESPLDVPLEDLPAVDRLACLQLLAELAQLIPGGREQVPRERGPAGPGSGAAPQRDAEGRVIDGRDGWLSRIAYHAIHDMLDSRAEPDIERLTELVWRRFEVSTDLDRPRPDGAGPYDLDAARRKLLDKLRLLRAGRLPPREAGLVEEPPHVDRVDLGEARRRLDDALRAACDRIFAWHAGSGLDAPPRIGVRATVGLGKTAVARRHLLDLRQRLKEADGPTRLLVCTPSHRLAEEAAEGWRAAGAATAVLRGYEARHPTLRQPMCRDPDAVRAALAAQATIQTAVCADDQGRTCRHFAGCLKQANRREVAEAEIVVAPYDTLFTGLPLSPQDLAAILIDEGCWARAIEVADMLRVETFAHDLLGGDAGRSGVAGFGAVADLRDLRRRAAAALAADGAGPVSRTRLLEAGLTAEDAELGRQLEARRLLDPALHPGMGKSERDGALKIAAINLRTRAFMAAWRAMARLLAGSADCDGRLLVGPPRGEDGERPILIQDVKRLHMNLTGRPILQLDATLRPELARAVLPGLDVVEIEAEAPSMAVRLVAGRFGKRALSPTGSASSEERARLARRLGECVDYVRWHTRRVAPGRVLVATYEDIEPAFADIPGVETAHFNAIAGLDAFRDVRLLVAIGRPLPPEREVRRLCGAFFGHVPAGGYRPSPQGVPMRDGVVRGVRAFRHEDPMAEQIRAAICDDEVIQAIGRGRGVNRMPDDPLDVHILADVALPLEHDRLLLWELEKPTIVHRMLLAGMAVDSPTDAAVLHADLLGSAEQAKKAFQRAGFKGQTPHSIMREMSLKSAAYRRPGRGRGWQRAWWVDGSVEEARAALERAIGPLDGWKLD